MECAVLTCSRAACSGTIVVRLPTYRRCAMIIGVARLIVCFNTVACWIACLASAPSVIAAQAKTTGAAALADGPEITMSPPSAVDPECRPYRASETAKPLGLCRPHLCSNEGTQRHKTDKRVQDEPDVVMLDELEDMYMPVPFDHKSHARMAEMTRGCIICHHCTAEGRERATCVTCHGIEDDGTDVRKPGLKKAYHLRCLNCHRDWIDETDCAACHPAKTGRPLTLAGLTPTADDVLGRMHPPIPEPSIKMFNVKSRQGTESVVIFRHWEHVRRFGLGCGDCHLEANCTRCHAKDAEPKPRAASEHHRPCSYCHGADIVEGTTKIAGRCKRCHWQKGDPKIRPFDHADTGWPLDKYHQARGCRDCHKSVPFVKQSTDCNSCHKEWEPDTFDHAVTGQVLDENHKEIDCAACHAGREFDTSPKCGECHDEDEELAFPSKRPGPWRGEGGARNQNR